MTPLNTVSTQFVNRMAIIGADTARLIRVVERSRVSLRSITSARSRRFRRSCVGGPYPDRRAGRQLRVAGCQKPVRTFQLFAASSTVRGLFRRCTAAMNARLKSQRRPFTPMRWASEFSNLPAHARLSARKNRYVPREFGEERASDRGGGSHSAPMSGAIAWTSRCPSKRDRGPAHRRVRRPGRRGHDSPPSDPFRLGTPAAGRRAQLLELAHRRSGTLSRVRPPARVVRRRRVRRTAPSGPARRGGHPELRDDLFPRNVESSGGTENGPSASYHRVPYRSVRGICAPTPSPLCRTHWSPSSAGWLGGLK